MLEVKMRQPAAKADGAPNIRPSVPAKDLRREGSAGSSASQPASAAAEQSGHQLAAEASDCLQLVSL